MHTQLIISLISIAAAAAVALACDFMRARNAQLRQEVDRLAPKAAKRALRDTAAPPRAARRRDRIIATAAQPPRELPVQRHSEVETKPVPKANPALTTWLIERAVERAAQKTEAELTSAPQEQLLIEAPKLEASKLEAIPKSVVVDKQLWDFLASIDQSTQTKPEESKSGRVLELIQGSGTISSPPISPINIDMKVPAGMHPQGVLSQLMDSREPFTGLVISIGVSAKDPRETRTEDWAFSVEQFIAGLLRTSDFGCRVDDREFLLLCPGPRAAEAQRHLSHVSERLWDCQLRALGKLPLVFNMGGTDVQGESLADAIATAQQRMNQSRRSEKSNSMSLVPQRKRAV